MKSILATSALLTASFFSPSGALAAEAPNSIHYTFETVLVPDQASASSKIVERGRAWLFGSVHARRLLRIADPVFIAEKNITIAQGTILAVADSDRLIACTFDRPVKFRLGRSKVCLIDMDRNGSLDHWFRRGDDFAFDHSSDISPNETSPISPVETAAVDDPSFGRPDSDFAALVTDRQLRICFLRYALCALGGTDIVTDGAEHELEFLGGRFKYQYLGKKVQLETLTMPQPIVLERGFSYSVWNMR